MPTLDEEEVCKFAAGHAPSPLHCGCPQCCPELTKAEQVMPLNAAPTTSEMADFKMRDVINALEALTMDAIRGANVEQLCRFGALILHWQKLIRR